AVRDDVEAELAARRLDPAEPLARRRPVERREAGDRRAGRLDDLLERLLADLDRLAHLGDADKVAREAVALGPGHDLEVELRVGAVRDRAPQVVGDARGAQDRPAD